MHSFVNSKYFLDWIEDSEKREQDLSESSTRLKKYLELTKLHRCKNVKKMKIYSFDDIFSDTVHFLNNSPVIF